jgi:integrase/recombinase XerD
MNKKSVAQLMEVDFNHPIDKFEKYLIEKGKSDKTIDGYIADLLRFQKFLSHTGGSLTDLTRIDVQNYINEMIESERATSTIDRHYNAIKQFAKANGIEKICEHIRKPQKTSVLGLAPKALERSQLLGILRRAEQVGNKRSLAIIYLLTYTGIRIEECEKLNRKDLDFKRGGVITVTGKGNKTRKVPFPKEARFYVKEYLDTRTDDNKALFLSNYKKRMDKRSLQRVIENIGKEYNAKLPEEERINIHAHIFRHTYARNLIKGQGVDIVTAAGIMGHESIETTRRYAMDSLQAVSEKLDNMTFN